MAQKMRCRVCGKEVFFPLVYSSRDCSPESRVYYHMYSNGVPFYPDHNVILTTDNDLFNDLVDAYYGLNFAETSVLPDCTQ